MAGPAGSDAFADAAEIAVGDTSAITDLAGYSTETAEAPDKVTLQLPTGGDDYVASAWWKFTPTVTQTIRLDLLGSFDTESVNVMFLNVYTGGGIGMPEADEALLVSSGDRNDDGTITHIFLGSEGVTYWVQVATTDTSAMLATGVSLSVAAPDNYVWLLVDTLLDPDPPPVQMEIPEGVHGAATSGEALRTNDGKASYLELDQNSDASLGTFWSRTFLGDFPVDNDQIISYTTFTSHNSGLNSDGHYGGSTFAFGLPGTAIPEDPADWPTLGEVNPDYGPNASNAFLNKQVKHTEDTHPGFIDAVANLARTGWNWYINHNEDSLAPLAQMSFHGIMFELDGPVRKVFRAPPLRRHPRSDGLASSTSARKWPPTPSIQASNRRAGGYL